MPAALAVARSRPGLQPAKRGLGNANALTRLDSQLAALEAIAQVWIGRRLVERLGQLNTQISGLERELAPLVRRRHALLLAIPGCGVITAARLIAEIANIGRFRDDAKLASYAGVAPVDASSGKHRRHIFSNPALYLDGPAAAVFKLRVGGRKTVRVTQKGSCVDQVAATQGDPSTCQLSATADVVVRRTS